MESEMNKHSKMTQTRVVFVNTTLRMIAMIASHVNVTLSRSLMNTIFSFAPNHRELLAQCTNELPEFLKYRCFLDKPFLRATNHTFHRISCKVVVLDTEMLAHKWEYVYVCRCCIRYVIVDPVERFCKRYGIHDTLRHALMYDLKIGLLSLHHNTVKQTFMHVELHLDDTETIQSYRVFRTSMPLCYKKKESESVTSVRAFECYYNAV